MVRYTAGSVRVPAAASRDGLHHLFVSPLVDDAAEVLSTLAHELVHAAVGTVAAHGPSFRRLAVALGLTGRMTATVAGVALTLRLAALAQQLGAFPHGGLLANSERRKQRTRLLKIACPTCGYTARTTAKWVAVGLPVCPCGTVMRLNDLAEEDGAGVEDARRDLAAAVIR